MRYKVFMNCFIMEKKGTFLVVLQSSVYKIYTNLTSTVNNTSNVGDRKLLAFEVDQNAQHPMLHDGRQAMECAVALSCRWGNRGDALCHFFLLCSTEGSVFMGASRCVGLAQGAFDNLALGPCFTLTMFLTVGAVVCGILLLACVATSKNPMNKPASMPPTTCQNWPMMKCIFTP